MSSWSMQSSHGSKVLQACSNTWTTIVPFLLLIQSYMMKNLYSLYFFILIEVLHAHSSFSEKSMLRKHFEENKIISAVYSSIFAQMTIQHNRSAV